MQINTSDDVFRYVRDHDVRFIHLQFVDLMGTLRSVSVSPAQLERAFAHGIPIDVASIGGMFEHRGEELFLLPDGGTIALLPWRPQSGRVVRMFCAMRHADGRPYLGDAREILSNAQADLASRGYVCRVKATASFYLFALDDQGNPTLTPHDRANAYAVAPADRGENVRRDICLMAEEIGILPECSSHAVGPGQNEVRLRSGETTRAIDGLATFRALVRTAAAQHRLHASFMPRPLGAEPPNYLRMGISLWKEGTNLFKKDEDHAPEARQFMAGIMQALPEISAFLRPCLNAYPLPMRPEVSWAHNDQEHALSMPNETDGHVRMEVTLADPSSNPYLSTAMLLRAGMRGMDQGLTMPDEHEVIGQLPTTPAAALALARQSDLCQDALGNQGLAAWVAHQERELASIPASGEKRDAWEIARYF